MQSLVATLRTLVANAAASLDLPLGWHGEPFMVPAGIHLRGRISLDATEAAGVLSNPFSKVRGQIVVQVVAPIGQEAMAMEQADALARSFPRGHPLNFADGTGTITTPRKTAPTGDGKRLTVTITILFYAFEQGA